MISITEEHVESKLEVSNNHKQPMGLVHGGIYSTLAETICSYGANYGGEGTFVGVNNNTDFLSSVEDGVIHCSAIPIKKGRSYQLWECKIHQGKKLVAISKLYINCHGYNLVCLCASVINCFLLQLNLQSFAAILFKKIRYQV